MILSSETKLFLGIISVTLVVLIGAVFFFSQPQKPAKTYSREELIPKNAHIAGSASASAYLVEFSDFQCPACKAIKPLVDDILKTHASNLTFVYRHYPLSQHPYSTKAALAAEAASLQGKFYEMGDKLFAIEDQEKLSDEYVLTVAKEIAGLDVAQFENDWKKESGKEVIAGDVAFGNAAGVNATPTFFLNGVKLELTSFADLSTKVNEALK